MPTHRLTNTFTSGELSPLILARKSFKRYNSGCKRLRNMVSKSQGPVTRRSSFKFIFNLSSLDLHPTDPQIRLVPFVFNEIQSYIMIFFRTPTDQKRVAFAEDGHILLDGGSPYLAVLPASWDIPNFTWAQSADEMYIAQSGLSPRIITRLDHTNWAVGTITFTDQPTDWSVANGWPEVVTLHQQRLVYAANTIKRQTVWMSKAGSFFDFGKSAPVVSSDAVTFTLDSGTQNKIVWMKSQKSLNIGTIGNEWTVTGATRNALTPDNILAQKQTNLGSEPLDPLSIGITTLFLERYGRSINEFVYEFTTDSYNTSDLAILSKHITDRYSIIDWAYQQTPDNIIWSIRQDGKLAGTTYQRQHEVIGWHVHDTQGQFESIATIPGKGREDEVWVSVLRNIDGVDVHYLELMNEEYLGLDEENNPYIFMDSYISLGVISSDGSGPTFTNFIGLDHLEGKEVDIIVDGAVHPSKVVEGGSVTLNYPAHVAVAGLNFVSEISPTLGDITSEDGSIVGKSQTITDINIDFYNTLGGYIGSRDSEHGERSEELPFRVPYNLTDTPVPLHTGIYHYELPEGFNRESEYFIRQIQPLPMTIRSVTDTIHTY